MMTATDGTFGGGQGDERAATSTHTLQPPTDKTRLQALARRWRVLRLGCPMGCGSYHEDPCPLAEVDHG